jgi:pilus assembly protein CpaE
VLVLTAARGGAGVSTLCLNLAYELARRHGPEAVAVADFNLPLGSLSAMLGAEVGHDLLDITDLPPADRSPVELRKRLAWLPSWSFHLLPGAANPRRASRVKAETLAPTLQAMRASFPLTLVDLGRSLSRIAFLLFGQADLIAMVLSPDSATAGNTRKVLDFLREEGVDRERLILVSNRPNGGEPAGAAEVEGRLGRRVDVGIPHAGTNFTLAHSLHAPFSLRFPEEAATLALQEAATLIAEKTRAAA